MVTERSWGGEGAQFLEQFLTSGGNPFVKENDQQVMRSEGTKRGEWGERTFSSIFPGCLGLSFMFYVAISTQNNS